MTVFLAVTLFALARTVLAGYAGAYFWPVIVSEAAYRAAPFFVLALIAVAVERRPLTRGLRVLVSTLPWIALFALLGRAWAEPHTSVVDALGDGWTFTLLLLSAGLVAGLASCEIAMRRTRAGAQALAIAAAGWFVLGPELYQRLDHIGLWHRVVAGAGIAAAFALLGAGVFLCARTVRPRSVDAAIGIAIVVLISAIGLAPGQAGRQGGPPIVVVLIDTLRADAPDRRSASGAALMPRFQEIARLGVRYTQAVAPSPWTLPSVASLLSAMNPYRHETGRLRGYAALPGNPAVAWLGPALRDAGYQSAAFVNNPWLRPYYGFGSGYLTWHRYRGDAADGVNAALAWVDAHRARPYFLFLHLMDPHWPYEAPAGFGEPRQACDACGDLRVLQYQATGAEVRAEVRRRYDAETAFTDHQLGRLWDELRERGVLDDAWLVVTSDHGEEFWEHLRFLHGHSLYDELLRVPLLIVAPLARADARRGVTVGEQVRLEDVGATIADLARVTAPSPIDGRTLLAEPEVWGALAELSGERPLPVGDPARQRPVVAGFLQEDGRRDWAVRAGGLKYVRTADAWLPLLFDVAMDPGETVSVQRPLAGLFLAGIPDKLGFAVERSVLRAPAPDSTDGAKPGGGLERELRALGYVE